MTKGRVGIGRCLAPVLLMLSLSGLPDIARAGSDAPLPLVLEDVAAGSATELAPGAAALHVVFFAPWCPSCVDELKALTEIEERWSDRGYRLILIAVRNRNTRERLLRFSEQQHAPGRIYLDASGEAQRAFAADEIPMHFLLDATGRVVGRWPGLAEELEPAVRKLLLASSDGS